MEELRLSKFKKSSSKRKFLILSFSEVPWEGHWTITQKMMMQVSRTNIVVYLEPRKEWREIFRNLCKNGIPTKFIKKIKENLFVVTAPFCFPKVYKIKLLDNFIERAYHFFLKALSRVYCSGATRVLYIWEPTFSNIIKYYDGYMVVYHPYDSFSRYVSNHDSLPGTEERLIIKRADLFYTVSNKLRDYYIQEYGREPGLMPNAVDSSYFLNVYDKQLARQAKSLVENIPGIKIGYSGTVKGILDLEILITAAKELRDVSFVFIGGIISLDIAMYDNKLEELFSLDNVYHLGHCNYKLLPYLLQEMDILIMIYSSNKEIWTYYGHPAKLFEYMAAGKPIVSTPHPAVSEFDDIITIVKNDVELIGAINKLRTGHTEAKRRMQLRVAKENTWEKRVQKLLKDLAELKEMAKGGTKVSIGPGGDV